MSIQPKDRYDRGDPEWWESFGNATSTAEKIAMCFEEYWEDAFSRPDSLDLAFIFQSYYLTSSDTFFISPNPVTKIRAMRAKRSEQNPSDSEVFAYIWDKWGDATEAAEREAKEAGYRVNKPATPLDRTRRKLPGGAIYLGGHRLATQEQLIPIGGRSGGPQWGPFRLPKDKADTAHYCIVGTTRSGKTVLIRHLAESLKNRVRFVVYDDKTELIPFFSPDPDARYAPSAPMYILNPFDARSVAWDIAKDAHAPHRAKEIARILIPDQPGHPPYYVDTPRKLVAAAINALNKHAPNQWSFLDLLVALDNLETVLQHDEASRRVFHRHLAATHATSRDLLSTLDGQISPYREAAAAWSHAQDKISITEWARSGKGTLILGNHPTAQTVMTNINRVFFQLLAEALLDPKMRSKSTRRTYIFLDELEQLGYLEQLDPLLNKGAGLGVNLVLGFHDIQNLRQHYGQAADALIGQCNHYAFLRIANPTTARWASDILGTQRVLLPHRAPTADGAKPSTTHSPVPIERPIVSSSDLQQLPLAGRSGLTAYLKSICHPTYRGHIPSYLLFGGVPKGTNSSFPSGLQSITPSTSSLSAFEPRPEDHLRFPEHHTPYLVKLGFPPPQSSHEPSPQEPEIEPEEAPDTDQFNLDDFPRF